MKRPGAGAGGALGRAFADMPRVLKGITSFFAVFGSVSLVLPLLPGVGHRVAGETLSRAELWQSGLGPFALLVGAWLVLSALGLLRRARWACWGVILAYAPFVPAELVLAERPHLARQCALALLWGLGVGAYLLRTRAVARYLAGERREADGEPPAPG